MLAGRDDIPVPMQDSAAETGGVAITSEFTSNDVTQVAFQRFHY